MKNDQITLRNNISRVLGLLGLFWATLSPILGLPFLIAGLIVPLKIRNDKDGFFNILFNAVGIVICILYIIVSYYYQLSLN